MVLNRQAVMGGYAAHKQQIEDAAKRQQANYTDHFLRLADNESKRLRFAYDIATEDGNNQMLVIRMHDYFLKAENKYVRALCAELTDQPCYWCNVANQAIAQAKNAPDSRRKEALKNAYAKAAKDVFILPCHVFYQDEDGKWRTEGKLLQLTWGVKTQLVKMFEEGETWEDGDGNPHKTHNITAGNFILKRMKDDGGKVSYSLSYQGDKPGKFGTPTFEHVEKMILESRPPKVLQDQANDFVDAEDMGEGEEFDRAFA